MLTSQRKKIILEKLAQDGQVLAKQLSEMFGLSEDTVRRDLRELTPKGCYSGCMAAPCRFLPPLPALPNAISWNPAPNARSPKRQRR